jgi:hypothetical protein
MGGHDMRKLFYRVASSRFSIVAVAVVAFAALELLAVQQASAGVWCCNNTNCTCDASLACPTNFPTSTGKICYTTGQVILRSALKSTIDCVAAPGFPPGTSTFDGTSFLRIETLLCTYSSSDPELNGSKGIGRMEISYTRAAGLTLPCVNNHDGTSTLEHAAFCADVGGKKPLFVGGTITFSDDLNPGGSPAFCQGNIPCGLSLGMDKGHCDGLVPGDPTGKVLSFKQTFAESASCGGQVSELVGPFIVHCNGGTFDFAEAKCSDGNQDQSGFTLAESVVQFDPKFSGPLNVVCSNQDNWRWAMSSNQSFEPALVDPASITVGGFGLGTVSCGEVTIKKGVSSRDCEIAACVGCPNCLGRFVADHRNADLTFDLEVEGKYESGTAIFGLQHVTTTGQ